MNVDEKLGLVELPLYSTEEFEAGSFETRLGNKGRPYFQKRKLIMESFRKPKNVRNIICLYIS